MNTNEIIDKIRKLFAHSNGTSFEAESALFAEKARKLMEQHRIDEAAITAATGRPVGIDSRIVTIPAPAARVSVNLLGVIARDNGCDLLVTGGEGITCEIFGTEAAIAATIAIFETLRIEIARASTVAYADHRNENATSFRNAFVFGFTARFNARLKAARSADLPRTDMTSALALFDDAARAAKALKTKYPRTGRYSTSTSSRNGRTAGGNAANSADMGQTKIGGRLALNA